MTVTAERAALRGLIADLVAHDEQESADRANVLDWIDSGSELYRQVPPDQPPQHLVTYFLPYDTARDVLFLVKHRKAGLWLPPGVHLASDLSDSPLSVQRVAVRCRFNWRGRRVRGAIRWRAPRWSMGADRRHMPSAPMVRRGTCGDNSAARWGRSLFPTRGAAVMR